jgi:signal transduction histidine kinase
MEKMELLKKKINDLEAENRQLKQIILNVPGHVYWKDRQQVYQGCNQGMLDLHRLTDVAEFSGKDLFAFLPKEMAEEICQQDDEIMRQGVERVLYEKGLDDFGNITVHYLTKKKPLFNEKGDTIGLMGVSIDITAQKRLEDLARKNEVANQIIQKLKAISAGLSYEVRGPLAGIRLGLGRTKQLFAKLLRFVKSMGGRLKSADDEEVSLEELMEYQQLLDKMVQRIDASVVLMDMQLKNMMTDRIEQRFFQSQKIKHSIEQAVKTFPLVDEALRDRIQLNIHHDFSVCGDALLTKHLLWNLLHNALHAIQEEGRGEIVIKTEEMIEHHLLRFKDTARGMPVDGRFEPFAASGNGNNGLGLHFCQMVMKAYGGKIECYAQEGLQTEFLLFFPKEQPVETR